MTSAATKGEVAACNASELRAVPNTVDFALAAAERGLKVFPLAPLKKTPAISNWPEEASNDPIQISKWWLANPSYNYGIVTGPVNDLIVIDLDGAEAISWWASNGFPAGAVVNTPSGGKHIYYRTDGQTEIQTNQSKVHPKVDVRGWNGYVVGPGSITTGTYQGKLDSIPDAPGELLAILPERQSYDTTELTGEKVDAASATEERSIADIVKRLRDLPSVWSEGAGWRSTCYQMACWLSRMVNSPAYAMTEDAALTILLTHTPIDSEWGDDKILEQWASAKKSTVGQQADMPADQIRLKPASRPGRTVEVDQLAARREGRRGHLEENTQPIEAADQDGYSKTFERRVAEIEFDMRARSEAEARVASELYDGLGGVVSWAELESFTEKPWLVEGLISAGELSLLVAKRNIGKSMLAFSLSFSVATGLQFLGRTTQQGAVLLVLGEGARGFAKRMQAWCAENQVDPKVLKSRLTVYQGGNLSNASSIADIVRAVAASNPVLIIIDTWTALNGIEKEVDQSLQQRVINAVKLLAPDAAKLVLHHPNGETEDTESPKARGGTALPSAAETVITMFYDRKHNVQGLPGEKWIAISTEEHHGGKQKEAAQVTIRGLRISGNGVGKFIDYNTGSTMNLSDQWVFENVTVGETVTIKGLELTSGASGSTIRRHLKVSQFVQEYASKTGGSNEFRRAA